VASGIRERVSVKEQGYVFGGNISRSCEESVCSFEGRKTHVSPMSSSSPVWDTEGMCRWIGMSGQ
jgi:hypothetical protein